MIIHTSLVSESSNPPPSCNITRIPSDNSATMPAESLGASVRMTKLILLDLLTKRCFARERSIYHFFLKSHGPSQRRYYASLRSARRGLTAFSWDLKKK